MHRTLLFLALVASGAAAAQAPANLRDIDKINGGIVADAGQAYGDLSTVNGSIQLADRARAQDVATVNGGVKAGEAVAADDVSTVNGSIRFGRSARIGGNVETVNGSIFFDRGGALRGDVTTVNGGIGLVDVDLDGGISTVNGDITVGIGSHVRGGITVEKPSGQWSWLGKPKVPRIVIGPGAVVEGPLVFEREVKLYVHASARTGSVRGATRLVGRIGATRAVVKLLAAVLDQLDAGPLVARALTGASQSSGDDVRHTALLHPAWEFPGAIAE